MPQFSTQQRSDLKFHGLSEDQVAAIEAALPASINPATIFADLVAILTAPDVATRIAAVLKLLQDLKGS